MLDVPESLLDERRRQGLDVFDEVWEAVLHMVPPPSDEHQRLGSELIAVFVGVAKRRGLVASYETGLFAADDDYRVPDIGVAATVPWRGAELVVEAQLARATSRARTGAGPGSERSSTRPSCTATGRVRIGRRGAGPAAASARDPLGGAQSGQ